MAVDAGSPGAPGRNVVAFASLANSVIASSDDSAVLGSHDPLPQAGSFLALCRARGTVLHCLRHGGDCTDLSFQGALLGCANADGGGSAPELETKLHGGLERGSLVVFSRLSIFLDHADRVIERLRLGRCDAFPLADGMTVVDGSQDDGGRLVLHAAGPVEVDTLHESVAVRLPDNCLDLAASAVIGVELEDVAAWDLD